ncbi:MAG: pepA [Oscillospiraceae bacterium]|jgi:endoglucanase|nr:pepA [Oscillospiraceae bacterium]
MLETVKALCEIDGISGFEQDVAAAICKRLDGKCEYKSDNLGNIIAFKKGRQTPKNKVMLSAHMDEVGMIVTGVKSDGMLITSSVGGVDPRVILGRAVRVGEQKITGVIGTKAIHMQTADERSTAVSQDNLYIDIGAKDKEDALKQIHLGDSVSFVGDFVEFGDGFVCAKALDDRFGCAVLLDMIESELEYDTTFVFCTQEEVGLRGSRTAAYSVDPDFSIVIEATTAADMSNVDEQKQVCKLGDGAVVTFMDRSTIYDKQLYQLAFSLAEQNSIKCQTKTMVAGGNDAGAIHITRGGIRTIAISIPARYIHSPSSVVKKSDMEEVLKLAKLMAKEMAQL